jgi:hypothetical protein
MYRGAGADGAGWSAVAEPLNGNALVRLDGLHSRGFSGKIKIDTRTNTSGWAYWDAWGYDQDSGTVANVSRGASRVTRLPPVLGDIVLMPSATRLANGDWITIGYGTTRAAKAAGDGNRTCVGMYHWQAHFCSSDFVLGTSDGGHSWQFRSELSWVPAMGKLVGGASEPAVTLLADKRTLLAVFRVEQHTNLWQATSTDGGFHWSPSVQTNAWSVFPQLKTLSNGATVLAAGRPGLGFWVLQGGAEWKFYNLAAEHNRACAGRCGVNSTYTKYELGIVNATTSIVDGPRGRKEVVHISAWRWTHPTTPPMSKAYFGLETGGCRGEACDVWISYDRDANGGEGPDCPMCKVHRLYGNYDKVFVMKVTVRTQ